MNQAKLLSLLIIHQYRGSLAIRHIIRLTPWSTILLEKLIYAQLARNFPSDKEMKECNVLQRDDDATV